MKKRFYTLVTVLVLLSCLLGLAPPVHAQVGVPATIQEVISQLQAQALGGGSISGTRVTENGWRLESSKGFQATFPAPSCLDVSPDQMGPWEASISGNFTVVERRSPSWWRVQILGATRWSGISVTWYLGYCPKYLQQSPAPAPSTPTTLVSYSPPDQDADVSIDQTANVSITGNNNQVTINQVAAGGNMTDVTVSTDQTQTNGASCPICLSSQPQPAPQAPPSAPAPPSPPPAPPAPPAAPVVDNTPPPPPAPPSIPVPVAPPPPQTQLPAQPQTQVPPSGCPLQPQDQATVTNTSANDWSRTGPQGQQMPANGLYYRGSRVISFPTDGSILIQKGSSTLQGGQVQGPFSFYVKGVCGG